MISRKELVEDFSQKVNKGKGALFVGAGISIPQGLQSFEGLIRVLGEKVIDLEIEENFNFPEIAQYIVNEKDLSSNNEGKKDINDRLRGIFNLTYKKDRGVYHEAIASSNINVIWTTNYDTLIEQCLISHEKNIAVKNKDTDLINSFQEFDKVEILKIHGDINSDDMIITKRDYEDFNITHKIFIKRLEQDLLNKTLLFIGYSYKDPNIHSIVNNVRQLIGEDSDVKHYMILQKEKEENAIKLQKLWIKDLKRYGLYVYLYDYGNHKDLESILLAISLKSKGKSVFVTGSHYNLDNKYAVELGEKLVAIKDLIVNYGHSKGIGSSVVDSFAKECVNNKEKLTERLRIFPNPYAFSEDWDNSDDMLDYLEQFRERMMKYTQILVAFPGGKGTFKEIEIAKRKGTIILPVLNKLKLNSLLYEEFSKEILKNKPDIVDSLKNLDNEYYEKLISEKVEVEDIVKCLNKIYDI